MDNKMPLVSVVISCFNSGKYIRKTIESVLNQTYKNYEIIAIDDGSYDETKSILAEYPQIRYFYQENKGTTWARNSGLEKSMGKYIIFLDHDDVLYPDRIFTGVEYLENHPNCAFILGWFDYIDSNGNVFDKETGVLTNVDYKTMLKGDALVSPSGCIFRKEHLIIAGSFDIDRDAGDGEEYDLYLRLSRRFSFYFQNTPVFQYRRHGSNVSTSNGGVKTLSALLELLDNQLPYINGKDQLSAYRAGKKHWRELLGPHVVGELVVSIKTLKIKNTVEALLFLLKQYPVGTVKHLSRRVLKRILP